MDKAGREGKLWISGLYEYRVTPQSGSIASPLQLIKGQGNKPEKNYIELTPGTPVWVQHRQNATWEPATVLSQCTPNSYWIHGKG